MVFRYVVVYDGREMGSLFDYKPIELKFIIFYHLGVNLQFVHSQLLLVSCQYILVISLCQQTKNKISISGSL